MAGYVYRGTDLDANNPLPAPKIVRPPTRPKSGPTSRCGTLEGYRRHIKAKRVPCQPCRDANAKYNVEYTQRAKAGQITKDWSPVKCGTVAGYSAHRRHAVPLCGPCRDANADYARDRRDAKRAA